LASTLVGAVVIGLFGLKSAISIAGSRQSGWPGMFLRVH
jgi:hypothetical protein